MNSPKLIAFYKGTAGEYNKLGAFAVTLTSAAAHLRNHISPFAMVDCGACNGTGRVLVPNGPDDVDTEVCTNCDGRGRVVAN